MFNNIKLYNIINKCNIISYKTLNEIIKILDINNFNMYSKGSIGNLVETFFELPNCNKSQCDFLNLGIELKIISLNKKNEILNPVFICSFSPNIFTIKFEDSILYKKIKHILFIPYLKVNENILDCKFLKPFFFKINKLQKDIIENDWNNILRLFYSGNFNKIKFYGQYIQLLSHAKNNFDIIKIFDKNGYKNSLIKKSFYFKKCFFKNLIN